MNINVKNTDGSRTAWMDTADLEMMITGIAELSRKLLDEAYSDTPNGIFTQDGNLTQGENAINHIYRYHEMTSGALMTISSVTGMLSKMFTNGDASIVFTQDTENK